MDSIEPRHERDEGAEAAFRLLNAGDTGDDLLSASACDFWYYNCGSTDCAGLINCCNSICNCAMVG